MTRQEKHENIERNHAKLADSMWVAIDEKVPFDQWIPIRTDREIAVDIICMFIDLDCYGRPYSLLLNADYTAFIKKENKEWKSSKSVKKEKDGSTCRRDCTLGA